TDTLSPELRGHLADCLFQPRSYNHWWRLAYCHWQKPASATTVIVEHHGAGARAMATGNGQGGKRRRAGGANSGRYLRTGRGWTPTGASFVLTDESGEKLKDRNTPEGVVREAYIRWRLEQAQQASLEADPQDSANQLPLMEVCREYLDHCKANDAANTYTV